MKNIDDLKLYLNDVLNQGINFSIYFGVMEAGCLTFKHGDLDATSTNEVCSAYVASVRNFFDNDDLSTLELSRIDGRDDVLVGYDLPTKPPDFAIIEALRQPVNVPVFSFGDHEIGDIKSIVIRIADAQRQLLFFKKVYPVSYVRQNQIMLVKSGNRLKSLDSDLIKIAGGFEVLLADNVFYINGFKKFEAAFDFKQVSIQMHQLTAGKIIALGFVNDSKSYLMDGIAPKRDMLRVAGSDVLGLPPANILNFAVANNARLGFSISGGKIQLSSKDSVKKLVKLLNDDYLNSLLTQYNYDSLAKNKLS